MVRRKIYLEKTPIAEARSIFFATLQEAGFFAADEEEVSVYDSLGRVTSGPVHAKRASPHFRSAAMDGIAVRSEQTVGARGDKPKLLKGSDFEYIDTGERVPPQFDAVIIVERINQVASGVEIYEPAFPGEHIREIGEDFQDGALVVPESYRLTPEAIAACLNTGNLEIAVKRRPKGIFIPTGSELVSPDADLGEDRVPESNSQIFKGYLEGWGGTAEVWPIIPDRYPEIKEAVERAIEDCDFLAISAGTSKGREDFTAAIVAEFGQVLLHGVGIAPGKPLLLGVIEEKPVLGLPGYPVAAWVCITQLLKPMLERYFNCPFAPPFKVRGRLMHKVHSSLGTREFVRVGLKPDEDSEKYLVYPLSGGSGRLSSLIQADGIVEVPEEVEGYAKSTEVTVELLMSIPVPR